MIKEPEVAQATQEWHLLMAQRKLGGKSAIFKINDRRQLLNNFSKRCKHFFFLSFFTNTQPNSLDFCDTDLCHQPPPWRPLQATNNCCICGMCSLNCTKALSLSCILQTKTAKCNYFSDFNIIQVLLLPPL